MNTSPLVTVVIPNWNGEEVLPLCLDSLERQTFRNFHTLVIDNGSRDGSFAVLEKSPLSLSLIRFPDNRGFASAVNAGIFRALTPYILLLNNDVVLDPRCLEHLVHFLHSCPSPVAAVAARIMQWDHPRRLDSLGNGMSREGKGFQIGWGKTWKDALAVEPFQVFGACAACALYRKTAFDQIGGMDAHFFAYLEDVDWSLRSNLQGLTTWVVPRAVAHHRGSYSTGGHYSPFSLYFLVRNQLALLIKNLPTRLFFRCALLILLGQLKTAARAILLEKRPGIYAEAILGFVRDLPLFWQARKQLLPKQAVSQDYLADLFRLSERQRKVISQA